MSRVGRWRRVRWLVAVAVLLGAATAILFVARPFRRDDLPWIDLGDLHEARPGAEYLEPSSGVGRTTQGPGSAAHKEIRPLIEEATTVVRRLCERFPGDARSLGVMAQVQQRFGNATESLRLWNDCVRLDPNFIEAYCGIGSIFNERGEYDQAEIALRRAFTLDPTSPQVSVLLANALLGQGKTEETITVLERSVQSGVATMPNFVLLGQAHLQLGHNEAAKQCFQSAVQMAPEYPNAYYSLAMVSVRLGHRAEAIEYRKRFKELQSKDLRARVDESKSYEDIEATRQNVAEIYVGIGRLYTAYGDDQAAEDLWTRAAELDPQNTDGHLELAQLYAKQDRPRDALDALLPLCRSRADDFHLWLRLGQLHARLDEFAQAEEALRHVVDLAPQQALGYAALAQLRLQSNHNVSDAVEPAREAVRLEPTAANYFLLATVCERCGELESAAAAIEKALQTEPANAQYRQLYLLIREKM